MIKVLQCHIRTMYAIVLLKGKHYRVCVHEITSYHNLERFMV